MDNNCEIIDPRNSDDWDVFVKNHELGTAFHTGAWAKVLCDSYGFLPYYLVYRRDGRISAGLPIIAVRGIFGVKKGVSLPFADFCEPLCKSETEWNALLQAAITLLQKKKWKTLELRGGQRFLNTAPIWSSCFTHTLNLNLAEDELLSACRESTRRNINKAKKQCLEITHGTTIQDLHEFYRLNVLTRREHGLPPQPWTFFTNLFDAVIAKEHGFISLAYYKKEAVAADLFLIKGEKAIYKYGASNRKHQHLRSSNLLMWEGMLHCKAIGAKSLNLGRTETRHEGLLQFKRGFGCSEEKIDYFRYYYLTQSFQLGADRNGHGLSTKILRHLPLFSLRLLGKLAYKYVG